MIDMPRSYNIRERSVEVPEGSIFGVEYIPLTENKKLPYVIMCHGYNSSHMDLEFSARALAESGICAYCFDFCGGSTRSRSSGSSLNMSISSEQRDLKSVIKSALTLEYVDRERLYLYGESQGGYVAALTATEMFGTVKGLFLIYPAFCIQDDWLKYDLSACDKPFEFMGMTVSKKFYDGLPRYDVYSRMSGLCTPTLIFHGDRDKTVDISYSQRLKRVMPNADLTVVEGAGHGFEIPEQRRVMESVIRYINDRKA